MIKGLITGGMVFSMLITGLKAQFHNPKTQTSPASVNPQAVMPQMANPANPQQVPMGTEAGRNYSGANMILPEAQRQGLSQYNVHLGQMAGKPVDIWGRAIHHSNGTYTESRQDVQTNTLEQITKSKNGTRLQRRMIILNAQGSPSEVMIYDGRDQFKYRGIQVYDALGRFAEEQIYDTAGTLIRRKVQEYNAQGQLLPLRSWDYVANVPEDLKLVITQEEEQPEAPKQEPKKERGGLFSGGARSQTPPIAATQAPPVQGSPAPEAGSSGEQRKGVKLGRLFGGKKTE